MKARITASVGIGVLVAALGLDAIKQSKAEKPVSFPLDFLVVDSTGKPIGPVIGTWQFENISSLNSGQTVAALPFQGKWLPVFVQRSSFVAPDLLFTSSDCTGQAFGDPSRSAFLATGVSANNTL